MADKIKMAAKHKKAEEFFSKLQNGKWKKRDRKNSQKEMKCILKNLNLGGS
jgi:hypothetical protein